MRFASEPLFCWVEPSSCSGNFFGAVHGNFWLQGSFLALDKVKAHPDRPASAIQVLAATLCSLSVCKVQTMSCSTISVADSGESVARTNALTRKVVNSRHLPPTTCAIPSIAWGAVPASTENSSKTLSHCLLRNKKKSKVQRTPTCEA